MQRPKCFQMRRRLKTFRTLHFWMGDVFAALKNATSEVFSDAQALENVSDVAFLDAGGVRSA